MPSYAKFLKEILSNKKKIVGVINQIKGEWDTKHPNLIPYKEYVLTLLPHFEEITFEHFPREENQLADTLATMSSMSNGTMRLPGSLSRSWTNLHTAAILRPKR